MKTQVIFWDVQHGSASYIRSPNDRDIVIDLGAGSHIRGDIEFSPLLAVKKYREIEQLDYVVITHPHRDHIDDILNFDALGPKVLMRPQHLSRKEVMKDIREEDWAKYEKYFEINSNYNEPLGENNPDDPANPENYGGLEIKSFGAVNCPTSNINNHSIIIVMSYAGIKVVFTGDNEACSFNELLTRTDFKTAVEGADILLAPHHGRESGYHAEFIDLVNPRLTIISDGRFGDTSATSRYSNKNRGWVVNNRNGESEDRKCLTTRADGNILVEFGYKNDSNYLSVGCF